MSSSSPPPPPPSSTSQPNTKLPRFIRNQQGRDRSRSTSTYLDPSIPAVALSPGASTANDAASQGSGTGIRSGLPKKLGRGLTKKRSRLLGRGSDSESKTSASSDRETLNGPSPPPSGSSPSSSPPMIMTTPTSPQSGQIFGHRTRNSFQSTRPPSSFDPGIPSAAAGGVLPSNASIISTSTALHHRLSDIPGRFTGWLGAHFTPPSPNTSAQSLSSQSSYPGPGPSSYPAPSPSSSQPESAASSAVGNQRHSGFMKGSAGKAPGAIERAIRYVFDSDANPDRSEMPIWLLGTQYPGWTTNGDIHTPDRSPSQSPVQSHATPIPIPNSPQRDITNLTHASHNSLSSTNSNSGLYAAPSSVGAAQPAAQQPPWPPSFHASFASLIYLTYRSHFKPIPPSHPPLPPPSAIDPPTPLPVLSPPSTAPAAPESPNRRWLAWVPGRSELTSDTGWGCMLRTGQMVLANALISLHIPPLPPPPLQVNNYPVPSLPPPETDRKRFEAYVRILVWFLDDPSVLCPFSVHRLALAGAEMGRDVGHWFGPSIAAGSIKKLVNAFPSCGLGVVVPPDQIIHETAVFTASHTPTLTPSTSSSSNARDRDARERANRMKEEWGDRAVLILIGLRLGLDGVTPTYYDSIKALFTFPQTVGIAGGRPSSSYYFVGTQGDHLFYLDPHSTRPAVPLRVQTDPSQPYDPTLQFSHAEMKTFHCDKVRKMHISGMDPSMLCAFIVRNLEEWRDLRSRVDALAKANGKAPIFTIADAPAAWEMQDADDMSDIGMESISSDSMSVDHEFDEPSPEPEDRELPTPTVAQHARMPQPSSSGGVVLIGNEGQDEEVQSPTSADADAELDEEWEQTPGLRSSAATSSTTTSSSNSTGNERAETPVLVPFPLDPNPSPSGTRRTSFGAAGAAQSERERERETAKTLVPPLAQKTAPSSQPEPKPRAPSKDRNARQQPAAEQHREQHRERVSAISPPAQTRHHHSHSHSHPQPHKSHTSKPSATAPTAPDNPTRSKPPQRLPQPSTTHQQTRHEPAEGEMSPPEELNMSMEFDTPRASAATGAGRGGKTNGAVSVTGGGARAGGMGRERVERPSRGRAESQWEEVEVG